MKAILAALVVATAGAGLGGAVLTGTIPLNLKAAEPEPGQGWEVLEAFTGDAADITEGTLDLRTFWGNIQVIGWAEPSYEITVYHRAPEQTGQRLSDAGIEASFEETRDAGLGLTLLVQRTGSYDVHVNEDGWTDIAVVANVPAGIAWAEALVCSGQSHTSVLREALGPVLDALRDRSDEADHSCVEGQPILGLNLGRISMDDEDQEEAFDFPFALANLRGGALTVHAQYADLALEGLTFESAKVMTQYGEILGSIDAPDLAVMSQYGTIGLTTLTDKADIGSQYGDLYLAFGAGGPGAYEAWTQYGNIVAGLVAGPDRGYDALAATQYGEALIILDGIEYGAEEEDDGATAPAAGLPQLKAGLPIPGMGKPPGRDRDYRHGAEVEAQSERFDEAPVQVIVKALTQYGDVLITDGEMPEADEDEDHAS